MRDVLIVKNHLIQVSTNFPELNFLKKRRLTKKMISTQKPLNFTVHERAKPWATVQNKKQT